jgi:uncharacterized membrane protein YcaP (DUF421 family)
MSTMTYPAGTRRDLGHPGRLHPKLDEEAVVYVIASTFWGRIGDHGAWSVPEKVLRTAVVYFAIVIMLRVFGKRELAQLNSFDLVVLLLLSNVVQNAIIGPDTSLWGGLIGAATLLFMNTIVVRVVKRWPRIDRLFEGRKNEVVVDGKYDEHELTRLGLRPGDIETSIRRQGASSIDEVKRATIYPGGAIVVELNRVDENATRGDVERLERKIDQLLATGGS